MYVYQVQRCLGAIFGVFGLGSCATFTSYPGLCFAQKAKTLLHYVAAAARKQDPSLINLEEQMSDVRLAAKLSLSTLQASIAGLTTSLRTLQQEVQAMEKEGSLPTAERKSEGRGEEKEEERLGLKEFVTNLVQEVEAINQKQRVGDEEVGRSDCDLVTFLLLPLLLCY